MTRSEALLRVAFIDLASLGAAVVGVLACTRGGFRIAVWSALLLVAESFWAVRAGLGVLFWFAAAMLLVGARMAGRFDPMTRLVSRTVGIAAAGGAGVFLAQSFVIPGANDFTSVADGALWLETVVVLVGLAVAGLWATPTSPDASGPGRPKNV